MDTNNENLFMQGFHSNIREKLYHFYKTRKIPHILFYGENGCGKKTLVMDFIYLIYDRDKQKIKQNTMFSNCSHSKGIKHIRENLKEYSRSNVRNEENIYFKTIILYNFENLSVDGQSALRRVIEGYSQTTRFFIILQNKQRILQPILSRFSHIYVPLPIIDGIPTNLHKYNLSKMFSSGGAAADDHAAAAEFVKNIFENLRSPKEVVKSKFCGDEQNCSKISVYTSAETPPSPPTHKEIIEICETLYEKGLSCLDIIHYVSTHYSDKSAASNIIMCFHRVKSEYRNEKMLMLYILDYMFLRKDKSIKSVAFM